MQQVVTVCAMGEAIGDSGEQRRALLLVEDDLLTVWRPRLGNDVSPCHV